MDLPSVLELKVLNREVFVLRGNLGDYRPDGQTVFMITPGGVFGIEEVVLQNSQLTSGILINYTKSKEAGEQIGVAILDGTSRIRGESERPRRRSWPSLSVNPPGLTRAF